MADQLFFFSDMIVEIYYCMQWAYVNHFEKYWDVSFRK